MQRGHRVLIAGSVLLAGMLAALWFRHPAAGDGATLPESGGQLVLRRCPASEAQTRTANRRRIIRRSAAEAAGAATARPQDRGITVLAPLGISQPPPLAESYPRPDTADSAGWGASMGMMLPSAAGSPAGQTTHRIADGDTLRGLAERYLGDAERFSEIIEANRRVLANPELLPIGAVLKIPPRGPRPSSTAQSMAGPLVPVPGP